MKYNDQESLKGNQKSAVDREDYVRQRAYEIYVERGMENGHEIEDWLQAEAEYLAKPLAAVREVPKAA